VPGHFAPTGPVLGRLYVRGLYLCILLPQVFARGFCTCKVSARAILYGPGPLLLHGRIGAGAFSATGAGASCTTCAWGILCGLYGLTCARRTFLGAQAWNCLNRASDAGSLFSV